MPTLQSTRWCFTTNNYTQDHITLFSTFFETDDVVYAIVGREQGEQGTPHLQGFCILSRNRTHRWIRERLPHSHIEKARGSSKQAAEYCKKENDFSEFGEFPGAQGKRTDLEEVLAWSDQFELDHGRAPTSPEVAQEHPSTYIRYPRVVRALFHRAERPKLRTGELRQWQRELNDALAEDPDDRTIQFFVDYEGGNGKTWFQQYFLTHNKKSQLLTIGKRDDLAHAIDESCTVFLFNVPRDGIQFLQYTVLEQLKDRMVFSPKYNSRLKILQNKCHVVVFTNEDPDMTKMSADRYVITQL